MIRAGDPRWALALAFLFLGGCAGSSGSSGGGTYDGSGALDLGSANTTSDGGAASSIFAEVGFSACPLVSVDSDAGLPACGGPAPLSITLVPVVPGDVKSFLWTLPDGGMPASSQAASPAVTFALPGMYPVRLVVQGAGGQASAAAEVWVAPNATGAACTDDRQCATALECLCAPPPVSDGGQGSCPGALADGLCTRACTGGSCGTAESCVDLTRSIAGDPVAKTQPFRRALCLASCTTETDCRPGFHCRELPVLSLGEGPGGAYSWRKACFAGVLGDVGRACADANGKPAPSACIGGACASIGVRDACTAACDLNAGPGCPSTAACAAFTGDQTHPLCLARCDQAHPCTDPLLACRPADATGDYGFSVGAGEPKGATYCAPRRCTAPMDCAPAGRCLSGFCQPM